MLQIKIEDLSQEELKERKVFSWPIWEKEISRFDWTYESDEECYILEGVAEVRYENKKIVIEAGHFVHFPKSMNCIWDVKSPIRKHYHFPQ